MIVKTSSILPAHPSIIFEGLQDPEVLIKIASPIMSYKPLDPETLPPRWEAGKDYFVKLYLFKKIPMGKHRIGIVYFNEEILQAKSDESGAIARLWTHVMTLKPYDHNATFYADEIEIKAGIWTVLVWLFANYFYRHRQRKWKALLKK